MRDAHARPVRGARHAVACSLLAAAAYLGLALLVFAPALSAPRELLPYSAFLEGTPLARLDHRDQKMVVAVVARNAAALTGGPLDLRGDGQCYPTPASYTLGEHMFGLGLLAALPWALTHDPILTYNVVLVLTLWVAALTMYALALRFTRNPAAAFVAGLLFELAPRRIGDPSHPFVHGDLWTPLALLLLHRVLSSGGWGWTAAFCVAMTLVMGESLYPLLACTLLMLAYVPYLAWRHREHLIARLPQLTVSAAVLLGVAWLVFAPYLETRATWGVLAERRALLVEARYYLPGTRGFPGVVGVLLLLVALLDRLRGPRLVDGEDPRLAYLAGGLLILVSTIGGVWIPGLGWRIPSPILLARGVLPGLDAVRALPAVGIGIGLPVAFIAAYGFLALVERRGRFATVALAGGVAAVVLLGRFHPWLAEPSFGRGSLALSSWAARPPLEDVELVRAAPPGALLDFPLPRRAVERLAASDSLLLSSYSPRPTAACYNSFVTPVQAQLGDLAAALPAASAADALAALGFETVLVDRKRLRGRSGRTPLTPDELASSARRLTRVGATTRLDAYRLSSPIPVRRDFALLEPDRGSGDGRTRDVALVPLRGGTAAFRFHNPSAATFRHPDPLAPSDLVVRWSGKGHRGMVEHPTRALLPIALGPGASLDVEVPLDDPPGTGLFVVDVARAAEPATILASRTVRVVEGSPERRRVLRRHGAARTSRQSTSR